MPVWIFLQGLLLFSITASRPTYILGHNYTHGVWFYFPLMFVLKSSLAFLGILLLALVMSGAVIPKIVADLLLQKTEKQPSRNPIRRLPESPRNTVAPLKL